MSFRLFTRPVSLLLVLAVAGCANPNPARLIAQTIAPASAAQVAATHDIFIATNRAPTTEPGEVFAGGRSQQTAFAEVEISIPAVHETGKMELAPNPKVADPARYFAARRAILYPEEKQFEAALAKSIAARGGRALIFIHGYNTGFDAAVYRAAQIFHDAHYSGTPILFSWPSAGRTIDYVYDNNSATTARDALEETLRLVARAGATRVDLVAHSMGSWVTMEALRQLAISGDRTLGGRLADVILASPDIDLDVFKGQMRRYGVPERPFAVLVSQNDRALTLSGFIAGNRPRLGDYRDAQDLTDLGITVVDVTKVSSGDWLNHTKFAENPVLVQLLGERLSAEGELDERDPQAVVGQMESLVKGIGQTVGSAADIVITTPLQVIELATGQRRR
ncbi:alpha/beta hydrolase [Nitratireductor sp. ZSWI3]|uniref:alpha/beta hydrolase n=1 Tax=Nitratireductor sp. ZSWI3 TaxID=2966359 RepID=UPI0021500F63|nr:alpha/beta hydrolase [Nitratireductor sp. ZSWI3]MCR4269098.1 alpha/beta hydrolase [Nitratireductor sp. ZSWI3]